MRFISLGMLSLASLAMSSCSFHTSERIADYGREYDCVVLRKDSPGWVRYRTSPAIVGRNGKPLPELRVKEFYFQGERSLYTRRGARIKRPMMLEHEHGASFTRVPDAPVSDVYFRGYALLADKGKPSRLLCRPMESLPEGAEPVAGLVREKLKRAGLDEAVFATGDTSLTPHAIWAYPLAGVCAMAIDIPLSLVGIVPVAISLPFCELGLSLRDGVYEVAAQVAPQQQEPVEAEGN